MDQVLQGPPSAFGYLDDIIAANEQIATDCRSTSPLATKRSPVVVLNGKRRHADGRQASDELCQKRLLILAIDNSSYGLCVVLDEGPIALDRLGQAVPVAKDAKLNETSVRNVRSRGLFHRTGNQPPQYRNRITQVCQVVRPPTA